LDSHKWFFGDITRQNPGNFPFLATYKETYNEQKIFGQYTSKSEKDLFVSTIAKERV